ncbi:MAG TPA: tetratricopeptide repeat protein [Vicinamibacterales bacterium]|nr:tetratricopeptide repeat protein [Vicinamibacterales bacterium]
MTGNPRWRRVQDLFEAAVDLSPDERAALFDRECRDDADLRREVASLLVAHERTGAVDRLALQVLSPVVDQVRAGATGGATVEAGHVVSHYVVLDVLGAGGMGVVCRARDERLHRLIALKFLPPHLAADAAAKRRFLVEARAAAALEHPNVCTVYEVGEAPDGQLYLAMPLYEGETLQARIRRGPLPVADAVRIAREIAAGLAAAHQRGIVHRDIKPSNVMLLPDGRVKILDFGVAKVSDVTLTATGTPVGTVVYMSPEQTRGEEVDHRADVWALGVVLYEMLAGQAPFGGETSAAIAHAITVRPHRPVSECRDDTPPALDGILATALAKVPERRFASIGEMSEALDGLSQGVRGTARTPPRAPAASPERQSGSAPIAERRRGVVVVTLISDYSTLLERLEPADLEEAVGAARAAAVDAARRHGGLVNQALGEEIVSLFGIPAAHEDDDTRAVCAALDLHARVRAAGTPALDRAGITLAVQSGIDSGTFVAQRLREGPRRYAVSGAPAQIAARLASLAAPDEILISPDCQRIVRPFVATDPVRPVELQPGLPAVVPHRVLGESGVHTRLEAADRSALAPFTGRVSELATLTALVEEARGGRGGIALVVGDAGMGKSRIMHELRERVRKVNIRLLLGRCRAYGGVSPYLPVVEVLRDILGPDGHDDAPGLAARVRSVDPSLEPFIPLYLHLLSIGSSEFPVPRHLQGEHLHAAMVDAVVALIMATAQQSPLLLLLEDWHWADDASHEVLQRLADVVDSLPLAIVVATRPEAEILAEIGRRGRIVQLGPLEKSGTLTLLRALLGGDRINDTLLSGVHERTGGNPFFVEQVAHTLREEGAVVTEHGETRLTRDIESLRLPDTVQAVIRARLDRLDGDAREVLRIASVIGREFGRGLLATAVPPEIDTARAVERLRAAALIQQVRVVPEPAYRFKHVLTQEVAYGSLLEHQRKAAHGAIGRAIEQQAAGRLDDHAEALAHHFGQAEAWSEAVEYGVTAAERLRALSQYPDALAMFERLQAWVAHLPDGTARREQTADILLEQERLCETLGQRQRQQQIITELISLLAPHGASTKLAEAYLRQGDLLTLLKRFDAAERALNTVLRLSRDREDRVLERNALRSVGLLRWHQGRHAEALSTAEQTLEVNRALGDDAAIVGDLSNIGNILRGMGEYERARAVLEEAARMPAAEREPARLSSVLHNLANVHRASGDLEKALECLSRADDAMRVHMLPIQRSFHLTTIAHIRLQQGDAGEALRVYQQAVELSRRARHAEGLAQALRLLGELQAAMGQHAEAADHLTEAAALFAQLEDAGSEADVLIQVAAARERLNDWMAVRDAAIAVRRLRQAVGDRAGELVALEALGRAVRHLGDRVQAVRAFEEALALAATLAPKREMALHNTLGILQWEAGRYFDALGHYESGLRLCRATGDRAHEVLMLNSMGVTLARLQRHEEARTVLEESVALSRAIGERLLEAHALTALADVSAYLGRTDTARACLEASLALRHEIGDEEGAAAIARQLAERRGGATDSAPR